MTTPNTTTPAKPEPTPRTDALFGDLAAAQGEVERIKAQIGTPPEGSHPDEQVPRAQTWHQERLNWINEVERLRLFSASEKQAKIERGDMLCECQAELAALREDKARLDWLLNWNVTGHPFKTRAAIDAAMKGNHVE